MNKDFSNDYEYLLKQDSTHFFQIANSLALDTQQNSLTVFSIGCGAVGISEAAVFKNLRNKKTLNYVGVDNNKQCIDINKNAKEQTLSRTLTDNQNVNFYEIDASKLEDILNKTNLKAGSVDLVIIRHADFTNSPEIFGTIFNRIAPALVKPTGKILVSTYFDGENAKAMTCVKPYAKEGKKITLNDVCEDTNRQVYRDHHTVLITVDPNKLQQHLNANRSIAHQLGENPCCFFTKKQIAIATTTVFAAGVTAYTLGLI